MRVLVVIPRFNKGGAERIACDIAIEMQRRPGMQVKMVSFSPENAYPNLTRQLDMQCVPSKIFLSPYKPNRFQLDGYKKLLEDYQPDIIHSHLFEAEIISRSVDYPSAKYFSHCHDNMRQFETFHPGTLSTKIKLVEYYERAYLFNRYRANGGNRFIAISQDTYDYFERTLPADLQNITLVHNAVNFNQYNRINSFRPINEIRIVNTGSFVPKKNQVFLVEIIKALKQKGVYASLTMLGDGPEMGKVKSKAEEYGIMGRIHFAGNVERVEDYLEKANMYVHTAYYEAFGLVLIEAMAAGLPVVSLDGRGNRGLVQDGINGYFIKEQDADLFAEKIIGLMQNETLYRQMSDKAVEFARQLDIKAYVNKLLALYTQALQE